MTKIEKMRRYIERTGVKYSLASPYNMTFGEMLELRHMEDIGVALGLAFDYGRAKGERSARAAAKAEGRAHT